MKKNKLKRQLLVCATEQILVLIFFAQKITWSINLTKYKDDKLTSSKSTVAEVIIFDSS